MSGYISKDLRKLLEAVEDQGGTVRMTSKGHHQVRNEEGRVVALLPGSTGDRKAYLACRADLRRAGFKID